MRKHILIALTVLLWVSLSVKTQTPPLVAQDDIQSWNDVMLTVPLSKQFDFWTSVTMRFGKNISRLNDGRYAIGFIYKPDKHWTIQPFFWSIKMRNSRGQFQNESRLNLRIGYKLPIKSVGLSHRSTFEYRIRNVGNSWRYRPSLTIEKDLPKKTKSKIYLTDEVFYDSSLAKFSRNRFTIGITRTLTKILSLDLYYMRQNDGFSRPGDLHVIGTSWKFKL
ncbi:MAG: DUF2490 domain-containing protein [Pyrinomonadaceae bacterium]|nr:DUF2490 domain-containing protein [Pyrinomonadaceae bacterium]